LGSRSDPRWAHLGVMIQTQSFLHREGTTPHDVFYSAGRAPLLTSVRGASLETAEDDDDDDNEGQEVPQELVNEQVIHAGFLLKRSEKRKTWKRRWVVLRASQLALYRNEKEYLLLNVLNVSQMQAFTAMEMKRVDFVICIMAPERTWYFRACDQQDMTAWLDALALARGKVSEDAAVPSNVQDTSAAALLPPPIVEPTPVSAHAVSSSDDENDADEEPVHWAPHDTMQTTPLPEDGSRIIAQGYLLKLGSRRKQWRKRWFVLTFDTLSYARTHMDARPHRTIPTTAIFDAMESTMPSSCTPMLSLSPGSIARLGFGAEVRSRSPLEPQSRAPSYYFQIVTASRTFQLCVPTEEDEIRWLSALQTLLNRQRRSAK